MFDNSSYAQKIAVRHAALRVLGRRPNLVLDMFAGEGDMTRMIWGGVADRVVCIEKDKSKADRIERAEVIVGDNKEYLHLAQDACIIDCDAYGLVMPLIKQLPKNKLVVFTDGTAYAAKKNASLGFKFERDLRSIFSRFERELGCGGTVYYGWGITK